METELQLAQIEQDIIERFEPSYSMSDFIVYSFIQIWPSIELGFDSSAEDAHTAAITYIFQARDEHIAYIYFDTKFAYTVNPKNKNFKKDLEKQQLTFVDQVEKYNK